MTSNDVDSIIETGEKLDQLMDNSGPKNALEIIDLANRLMVFKQMYLFIKCAQWKEGTMVFCQLADQSKAQIAINSTRILDLLLPEFNSVGQTLDQNGIDTSALLAEVDKQYEQIYGRGSH